MKVDGYYLPKLRDGSFEGSTPLGTIAIRRYSGVPIMPWEVLWWPPRMGGQGVAIVLAERTPEEAAAEATRRFVAIRRAVERAGGAACGVTDRSTRARANRKA